MNHNTDQDEKFFPTELKQDTDNKPKPVNLNIKDRILDNIIKLPLNVLKMTDYYYSIVLRDEGILLFESIRAVSKDGKKVSGSKYIKHLALNRKFKKTNSDVIGIDGLRSELINDIRSEGGKFVISFNKQESTFLVDEFTMCRMTTTPTFYINSNKGGNSLKIEFIGLNAKKYYTNLYKIISLKTPDYNKTRGNNLVFINKFSINNSDGGHVSVSDFPILMPTFDKIVCKDETINSIISSINNFVKAEDIYSEYGINNALGIMFYGSPGTGKTSMIKAISNYVYGMGMKYTKLKFLPSIDDSILKIDSVNIYSLDVSTSASALNECIEYITNKLYRDQYYNLNPFNVNILIVIMEEIDSIINVSRDNDSSEVNTKIKILLEFLDGMNTPANYSTIFLASTNHYNKLDPALIRAGRFDLKIELEEFGTEEIIKMCELYKVDVDTIYPNKEYLSPDYRITPSLLQRNILDCLAERI